MNTATTMPKTVRELGNLADELGVKPSELLPPAGFTLDASSGEAWEGDYQTWSGPTFEGNGWKVTSDWSIEDGVTFYVDGDGDNAIRGSDAGKIAAALAEVAALAG